MTALRVRFWFWHLITGLSFFSQVFFYKTKNVFFLLWVNLFMITDPYLHDPPPFNDPFFMTPPFSAVSKSCDPPSVSTPPPRLPPANFWQVPKCRLFSQATLEHACRRSFCLLARHDVTIFWWNGDYSHSLSQMLKTAQDHQLWQFTVKSGCLVYTAWLVAL